MLRSVKAALVFSSALLVGSLLGAKSHLPRAYADADRSLASPSGKHMSEAKEPYDPKKKKAGDECKSSDECQSHHTCGKVDGKNVCVAPPRARLPPGAVT